MSRLLRFCRRRCYSLFKFFLSPTARQKAMVCVMIGNTVLVGMDYRAISWSIDSVTFLWSVLELLLPLLISGPVHVSSSSLVSLNFNVFLFTSTTRSSSGSVVYPLSIRAMLLLMCMIHAGKGDAVAEMEEWSPLIQRPNITADGTIIESYNPAEERPLVVGAGDNQSENSDQEDEIEERPGLAPADHTGLCSSLTSMDGDSPSATAEGMHTTSPNGKRKRNVVCWMKGQRLGSGSFGTAYEAISESGRLHGRGIESSDPEEQQPEDLNTGDDQSGNSNQEDEKEFGLVTTPADRPGSCSPSTSMDDDSPYITAEGMHTISPNGKLKRNIVSWMKGWKLGSGSFGTVYEAISEPRHVSSNGSGEDCIKCGGERERREREGETFETAHDVDHFSCFSMAQ